METTKHTKKPAKTSPDGSFMALVERFNTPEAARRYLESVRWPTGPVCPHCGVVGEATELQGESHRDGLYKCNACKEPFTVTVGTVMEDSHIPIHKWVIAMHLLCANKKGISALSIQRLLGLGSYRSAWHLCHRIRHAMFDTGTDQLSGVVEADETFVGGKSKNTHGHRIPKKTPVVALVQRDGKVKARAVTNVDETNIGPILKDKIATGAILMTDGANLYYRHNMDNPGDFSAHKSVDHSKGEYSRTEADGFKAHTNTVESFNATVKRSIIGAWHNVSERHLDRYVDECAFRWNTRDTNDGERTKSALIGIEGKRLTLRPLKSAPRSGVEMPKSLA